MIRWDTPRGLATSLIALSILTASCRESEKDVTGCWEGKDVVLRISREGQNGEMLVVQWKEPSTKASGNFSASLQNGKLVNGEPMFADLTYLNRRLIWRGEQLRRVAAEAYARAAPEL